MAFHSSMDAFMYAVHESATCKDLKVAYEVGFMRNGIKHCNVQLSYCGGGYSIDAYDGEADELCRLVKEYLATPRIPAVMPRI